MKRPSRRPFRRDPANIIHAEKRFLIARTFVNEQPDVVAPFVLGTGGAMRRSLFQPPTQIGDRICAHCGHVGKFYGNFCSTRCRDEADAKNGDSRL